MTAPTPTDPPEARLAPRRGLAWLWLLPLAALLTAGWLGYSAWQQRGIALEIRFDKGHGLKPGDALRYRGIQVGRVRAVTLTPDLSHVRVQARLDPAARPLARTGSRFWIVRPELGLGRVSGLETVLGANYLEVLPGEGDFNTRFVGLEEPPLRELLEPGGLTVVLTTPGKDQLRPGAPVSYRGVVVGILLAVELARDAGRVEATAYIEPRYRSLIRQETRFWKTSGARLEAGLKGISLTLNSVQTLLLGGTALAIPPDPGPPVADGHRFRLADQPDPDWLEWQTALDLNGAAPGTDTPTLLPARLEWRHKNLVQLTVDGRRDGWVLPVAGGYLGPLDLFTPPDDAISGSVRLQVGDLPLGSPGKATALSPWLGRLSAPHGYPPWTRLRRPTVPENSRLVAGPDQPVRFVEARRFETGDRLWPLDAPVELDDDWHGVAVVAEDDGAVIGMLRVEDGEVSMIRVPERISSNER